MEEPGILIAEDLTPSETVQMPKDKILAFVTRQGSSNSHTAILARIMGIPSLVKTQINLDDAVDGHQMIVDGFDGRYYIDPDQEVVRLMQEKKHTADEHQRQLEAYRGKESVTRGGQKVKLFANIGNPSDVEHVLKGDAEGVGLLRSEFLYLGRDSYPTEDELYNAYRKVVEGLQGRGWSFVPWTSVPTSRRTTSSWTRRRIPPLVCAASASASAAPRCSASQSRAIYRASCFGPRERHVPHDRLRVGGAQGQRDVQGHPGRDGQGGHPHGRGGARHYD